MKMEAVGNSEQLLDSEVPPVTQLKVDSPTDEGALDLQSPSLKDGAEDVPDSSGLSSMPCLLKELRRDSSESQLASTESDKPSAGRVYESDSSNHCMLSPSSSGHLADSDTLSSAEENQTRRPEAISEGCDAAAQGSTAARKSRRSRSESETSTMAAKKNRQSSDKQNGRVSKVKGHRSQKHKERIRLLRQKREAAARKKYNLLQDSSTSDSDLTCDSSTSSSDDDEEVSGGSKTITAEIPVMMNKCRSVRDTYVKELSKSKDLQRSGSGSTPRSHDKHFDLLSFWRNCYKPQSTEDSFMDTNTQADDGHSNVGSPVLDSDNMKEASDVPSSNITAIANSDVHDELLEQSTQMTSTYKGILEYLKSSRERQRASEENVPFNLLASVLPYMNEIDPGIYTDFHIDLIQLAKK